MLDTGVITPRIYRKTLDAEVTLHPGHVSTSRIREPYFFGYVRDQLIEAYGATVGSLRRAARCTRRSSRGTRGSPSRRSATR